MKKLKETKVIEFRIARKAWSVGEVRVPIGLTNLEIEKFVEGYYTASDRNHFVIYENREECKCTSIKVINESDQS